MLAVKATQSDYNHKKSVFVLWLLNMVIRCDLLNFTVAT